MGKWVTRLGASALLAAGIGAVSMVASIAAPPSATSADYNGARAAAVDVPGVVSLSDSTASSSDEGNVGDAHWSAATVAGTDVLGHSSAGWTGALAPLGAVIDALNAQLCPEEIATGTYLCAGLLFNRVQEDPGDAIAEGALADVTLLTSNPVDGTPAGAILAVGPSRARDRETFPPGCKSSFGQADLLAGSYYDVTGVFTPLNVSFTESLFAGCVTETAPAP